MVCLGAARQIGEQDEGNVCGGYGAKVVRGENGVLYTMQECQLFEYAVRDVLRYTVEY